LIASFIDGKEAFFMRGVSLFDNELFWALVLIIGFPVATVALGEIIMRLRRRGRPAASPLALVRNLVLPTLALLLFLLQVLGQDRTASSVRLVETLFWFFVINAVLSALNVLLFAGAREGTWQSRMPKLFIDLVRLIIVLILAAIMLSTVWNLDLGHLIAALGVGSIVLGLALQDPLGSLFSGLVLLFERPLKVGDWIQLGESNGRVVETNWRAVHLLTRSKDLIIIPNSVLAKGSFINFSRPAALHRETISIQFSRNDPPSKVMRVLAEAVQRTPRTIEHPDQAIVLSTYSTSGMTYDVKVYMGSYEYKDEVREGFQALVWYAARRHGLTMPYPIQTMKEFEAEERAPLPPSALAAFRRFDLGRGDGSKVPVSRQAVQYFAKGEQIIAEGDVLPGIYLVLKGRASMTVQVAGSGKVEIAQVGEGEFFGERTAFASRVSDTTATALEDLELLVIDAETLQSLVAGSPPLSREIGSVMEARRQALRGIRGAGTPETAGKSDEWLQDTVGIKPPKFVD
jgi:small-conductance mechanosensitive channel